MNEDNQNKELLEELKKITHQLNRVTSNLERLAYSVEELNKGKGEESTQGQSKDKATTELESVIESLQKRVTVVEKDNKDKVTKEYLIKKMDDKLTPIFDELVDVKEFIGKE